MWDLPAAGIEPMSPALAGKFLKSRQILDHQGRPIIIIFFKYYLFGCAGSSLCHSLVAQTVKSLPEMRETQVRSLGWEDPLEKEMATHSRILAWKIPWMEESGESMGSQRVGCS